MRNHVIVSVVLTASFLLPPLQAIAQAVSIYGSDPAARECYDSARRAVDFDETLPYSLEPCTQALGQRKLKARDRAATLINRGILNAASKNYSEAIGDYDTGAKMNPPLRESSDLDALKQALVDGTVDALATDHALSGARRLRIEVKR